MESTTLLIVLCLLVSICSILSFPFFPSMMTLFGIDRLGILWNSECKQNSECAYKKYCSDQRCVNCKLSGDPCNPGECCPDLKCDIRGNDVPRCQKPVIPDIRCKCYGSQFPYYGKGSAAAGPRANYCWADPVNFGEAPSIGINSKYVC